MVMSRFRSASNNVPVDDMEQRPRSYSDIRKPCGSKKNFPRNRRPINQTLPPRLVNIIQPSLREYYNAFLYYLKLDHEAFWAVSHSSPVALEKYLRKFRDEYLVSEGSLSYDKFYQLMKGVHDLSRDRNNVVQQEKNQEILEKHVYAPSKFDNDKGLISSLSSFFIPGQNEDESNKSSDARIPCVMVIMKTFAQIAFIGGQFMPWISFLGLNIYFLFLPFSYAKDMVGQEKLYLRDQNQPLENDHGSLSRDWGLYSGSSCSSEKDAVSPASYFDDVSVRGLYSPIGAGK